MKMAEIKKYKKKNGETAFKFTVYTGVHPLTGKKSKTTRQGFKTKREANIALKRIQAQVANQTYYDVKDKKDMTFQGVYESWRDSYKNTVAESTLLKNDGMFNNRILPAFGSYLINKIDANMIQKQVNEWSSFSNASKWLDEMSRVFHHARKQQIILSNPCELVSKPRKPKKAAAKTFYETAELKQFMDVLDDSNNLQAKAMLRLLAFTGLRKGEALALTWEDIDPVNYVIRVDKAISRRKVPGSKNKTELYLKEPKNYTSKRMTTIDNKTLELLLEWRELNPHKWVFVSEYGKWLSPSKPRKWLRSTAEKAGLDPIPVHKLRHTHATLLHEAGASIEEIQRRLGHFDISTTQNTYTHLTKAQRDDFAERFSNHIDF